MDKEYIAVIVIKAGVGDVISSAELKLTKADLDNIRRERPKMTLANWVKACVEIDLDHISDPPPFVTSQDQVTSRG